MKDATLALFFVVIVAGQNTTVTSTTVTSSFSVGQNATASSSSAAGQNTTANSSSAGAPIIFGVFTFLGPGAPGLVPAPIVTESVQNTTTESAQPPSGVVDLGPTFTFRRDTANPCLAAQPCQKLTIDNLNLEQAWDGCLFASETVVLSSGVLTLDLGTALLDSELCLWASSGAPEGKQRRARRQLLCNPSARLFELPGSPHRNHEQWRFHGNL